MQMRCNRNSIGDWLLAPSLGWIFKFACGLLLVGWLLMNRWNDEPPGHLHQQHAAATFWLESGPCGTPRGQRLSHLQLEHSDAKDKPVKTALAPFNRTHRKISSKFHPFSANQSRILLRVSSRKSATTFWRQIPPPQSIQLNLSTFYNVLMNCKSLNIS